MLKPLLHLWAAAFDLAPDERRRSVKCAAWVGSALATLVLIVALGTAGSIVPAEHPIWEAVLQARIALVRLVLAIPILLLGALAGVTLYQVLENTDLGKRLLIWHQHDDAMVEAQKTRNAGFLLASLLCACILGLLLGVLR